MTTDEITCYELEKIFFDKLINEKGINEKNFLKSYTYGYLKTAKERRDELFKIQKDSSHDIDSHIEQIEIIIQRLNNNPDKADLLKIIHEVNMMGNSIALKYFESLFPKSELAQSMLNPNKVLKLYESINDKKDEILQTSSDMSLEILRNCPVTFPFLGGFNSKIMNNLSNYDKPIIAIYQGITDGLYYMCSLVVAYGVEPKNGSVQIKSLKMKPDLLKIFRNKIISIFSIIETETIFNDLEIPTIIDVKVLSILHSLYVGGQLFIWFHEFAHVLIEETRDFEVNELLCDEFALRIIIESEDEVIITGAFLALVILSIFQKRNIEKFDIRLDPLKRMSQFNLLIEENKNSIDYKRLNLLDRLVDAPIVLLQEEIMKMTKLDYDKQVFDSLGPYFNRLDLSNEIKKRIIQDFKDNVVTVQEPNEEYLIQLKVDQNDNPIVIIKYDLIAACEALASLVGGIAGSSIPIVASCAVIAGLCALKGVKEEIPQSEGLILLILYEKRKLVVSRVELESAFNERIVSDSSIQKEDFESALLALQNLKCIESSKGSFWIKEKVIVIRER